MLIWVESFDRMKGSPQNMDVRQEKALELKELSVNYGVVPALRAVSLHVKAGEIATLLGANGAGKTTTLKAIYGLLPILEGEVLFFGESIKGLPPYKLVDLGMSFIAEERAIFAPMTVMDNLILGGYRRRGREKKEERERNFTAIFKLFPVLEKRRRQRAGTLSGGEQQMLALGRVLMANPRLLLLDEPSLGLAPMIVSEMMRVISGLRGEGISVFLIEQNARAALKIADRGYVVGGGKIITKGTREELLSDEKVQSAYLGGKRESV
jgi:branched-chain amino acid transport system ATP-binding protein